MLIDMYLLLLLIPPHPPSHCPKTLRRNADKRANIMVDASAVAPGLHRTSPGAAGRCRAASWRRSRAEGVRGATRLWKIGGPAACWQSSVVRSESASPRQPLSLACGAAKEKTYVYAQHDHERPTLFNDRRTATHHPDTGTWTPKGPRPTAGLRENEFQYYNIASPSKVH